MCNISKRAERRCSLTSTLQQRTQYRNTNNPNKEVQLCKRQLRRLTSVLRQTLQQAAPETRLVINES